MTLTNPSLELVFVGSSTIPDTTVSNSDIVRQSVQIEWQMMNDLKSTSDKAKISITKNTVAVEYIMSFDGDIRATLKDGSTTLFTGFLSNKYKWSVTNHGEQVLSLTIEDNTRLLETIFSDKDRLVNESFYLPATGSRATASGLLVELATVCGFTILGSTPEIDTNIIKLIDADTECVDILDQVCFELGYCYKFNALGYLYLCQIAKGDEAVSATLNKDSLYAVDENAVIVNKSLKQYNRAIVKYTEVKTRTNTLVYQDISGQDGTHPYCNITVQPGYAYPSGLDIASHTDDQLKAICDVTDLDEGKTIIGIGDTITAEFECTNSAITCSIQKYSATQVSVLIKNTGLTPITILKLRAKATITYEEGDSKVYAGSVSDKKYYETELTYTHDNTTATHLGNLIYQFYKHSNLSYQFYSKTQLALGSIIQLNENQHSGISAKLMVNAIVDSSSTGVYQYVAYSFSPFNLEENTTSGSSTRSPEKIPASKTVIQYAIGDSVSTAPSTGWQYTTPTPTTASPYVWMRTSTDNGTTWAYARLTGEQGEDGGEYSYELIVNSSTFYQDRRATGTKDITVYTVISGYTGVTSTITATNVETSPITDGKLTYQLNNNYTEIVVTAVLTDSSDTVLDTKTVTLSPVDITEAPMFLGCLTALPTTATDNLNIIYGDYFCVKSNFTGTDSNAYVQGECCRYTQTGWIKLNATTGTADEMLTCLRAFSEAGINFTEISDSSSIAWFNSIVTQNIIADTIKSRKGFFDNITIGNAETGTGSATFYGKIISDPLSTDGGSTSTKTYISTSASVSGGSFEWEDVADYIADNVTKTSGTMYTATGLINGKIPSKVVYYDSTPTNYQQLPYGTMPTTIGSSVFVYTTTYPTKLRITMSKEAGYPDAAGYQIYSGSTLETTTTIVSGMAASSNTITTELIPAGKSIYLCANTGGETYDVKLYEVDNFDVGTNVVTSDGAMYNIGRTGSLPGITYLTGVGTNLQLQAYVSSSYVTWVQCNSSSWTSGVTKYNNWIGKTGGTAAVSGSGTISSGYTIQVKQAGGSTISYSADYATWDSTSIQFTENARNVLTLNTSTSNLESWNISFSVSVSSAGLRTQSLLPKNDSRWYLGDSSAEWLAVYANTFYGEFSGDLDGDTTGTHYGDVGTSRSMSDAYIENLYVEAGQMYEYDSVNGGYLQTFKPARNIDVDYDNYSSSSSRSINLGSIFGNNLPRNNLFMYAFTGNYLTTITMPTGGTYKYVAVGASANTDNNAATAKGGSLGGGNSFTLGYSSNSRPYGCIILFFRYL